MTKTKHKILSVFLSFCMIISCMVGMSATASAVASPSVAQVTSNLSGSGYIADSYNTYFPGFVEVTEEEAKAWTGAPTTGSCVLFFRFDVQFHLPYRAVFVDGKFSNVLDKWMTVDDVNENLAYIRK